MTELSPCITKYVLVGLEAFYMTSFSWGFYFNKIKFLTEKNKQLKKSQKENLKRKRKSTMHANDLMKIDAICTCMTREVSFYWI